MRRPTLLVGLCLAGCSGMAVHWEKPGVDQATLQRDMSECRVAARQEAMRNYYPSPVPIFGARHLLIWQEHTEADRFYTENNLTRFCMNNKGYELVPDQPPNKSPEKS